MGACDVRSEVSLALDVMRLDKPRKLGEIVARFLVLEGAAARMCRRVGVWQCRHLKLCVVEDVKILLLHQLSEHR